MPNPNTATPIWEKTHSVAVKAGLALTNLGTGENTFWCMMPGEIPVSRRTVKAWLSRDLLKATHRDLLGGVLSYDIVEAAHEEA